MDPPEEHPPDQQPPQQQPEDGHPSQPFFTMTIAVPGLPPAPPEPGQEGAEPAGGEHNGPGGGTLIYSFQIGAGPPPGEGEEGNPDHPPLPPDFFSQFAQPPGAPGPGGNAPEGGDGAAPPPRAPPAWLFAPFLELLVPRREPQPNPEKAAELLRSLPTVGKRLLKRVDNVVAAQDVESYEDEDERGWKCGVCLEGLRGGQEQEAKVEDKKTGEAEKGEEKGEDAVEKKEESEEKKDSKEEPKETTGVKALPCNHLFHGNCLEPWFATHHTCPTCRLDLDPLHTLNSPPRAPRPARTDSMRPARTGAGSTRASANAHPYARGDGSQEGERSQPPSRQASSSSIPTAGPSTNTAATGDATLAEQRQENGQPQRPVPRRSQTSHHFFIFSNSPFPPTPRGEQPTAPAPASASVPPPQAASNETTSSVPVGAPETSSTATASTSTPTQPEAASLDRSSAPEPASSRPGSPHPEGGEGNSAPNAARDLFHQLDIPSLLDGLFGFARPPALPTAEEQGAATQDGQEAPAQAETSAQPARAASAPVEGSEAQPAPEGNTDTSSAPSDANPAPSGSSESDRQRRSHMQMVQSTMDLLSRMAREGGNIPPPLPDHQGGPPAGPPPGFPPGLPSFLFPGLPRPHGGEGTPDGSRSGTPGGEFPPAPQPAREEPSKPAFVPQSLESWTEEKEKVLGWRCEAPECMYGPALGEDDEGSEMPAVGEEDKQDKEMINIFSPLQPAISLEAAKQAHADDHQFTILACSHRWHRGCLEGAARSAEREIRDDGEGRGWVRCERCRKDGWVVPRELERKGKGREVPIMTNATASVAGKKREREDDE
ncbi:hypothetical protein IAR50_000752 [Cryptococcus sp. DSM 104548]